MEQHVRGKELYKVNNNGIVTFSDRLRWNNWEYAKLVLAGLGDGCTESLWESVVQDGIYENEWIYLMNVFDDVS